MSPETDGRPSPTPIAGSALTGKCALITGSIDGIGFATATRLAAEGCNIMLSGLAEPSRIAARRAELAAQGVRTLSPPGRR